MEVDESNNFVYNKFDSMDYNSRLKLQELLIQTLEPYRDLLNNFLKICGPFVESNKTIR